MSRKLFVAIAVISCAFIGTTFAAVENIKVSGDIKAEAITRNLEMGLVGGIDHEDFIFSQVRLRFDADLTEGVSAVIRLLNERIWGDETDSDTEVQLDLAYVELKEFLYQPLTFIIGRQNLRYGSGLIIGDPDTNRVEASGKSPAAIGDLSLRKSFDAVRAIFDYAPYTVDLVYAKVDENTVNVRDDITIIGANIAYEWSSYNGITEVYGFWVEDRTGSQIQEDQEDRTITLGARTQFDPNDNLTLGFEGAFQLGDDATDAANSLSRNAFAVQVMADYNLLDAKNTKIGVSYTYLSGDGDPGDDESTEWDPLFEDQSPAEIINLLQVNSNAQYISASVSCMPQDDITVGLLYTHARLVDTRPTLVGATAGNPITGSTYVLSTNDRHFGDEIDLWGVYDYTEDVQLSLNGAIFLPGDAFASANDNTAYSLRGGVNVNF